MTLEKKQKEEQKIKISTSKKNIMGMIKNIFDVKSIPYVLVLFFAFNLKFLNTNSIVAYSMLAIATLFNIPLVLPLIVSMLSFLIFKSSSFFIITYILTYIMYTILTAAIDIKGISQRYISIIKIVVSYALSCLIYLAFTGFKLNDAMQSIKTLLLFTALIPIFASGFTVIFNINKKIVFSAEEIISAIIVVAITIMPLAIFKIYGVSIVSIIFIVLIILVSWQNDWRIGCTTAVALSLIYLIITKESPIILTIYIFSGLIAGLFNRLNKWFLAIVFLLGNIGIISLFSISLLTSSKMTELLISALIIMLLPKNAMFRLENIFSSDNVLKEGYNNILGPGIDMKNRAGSISEIFESIANYDMPVTDETLKETETVVKKYLEEYSNNKCITCKNKKDCLNNKIVLVSKHIASSLERGLAINQELFPKDCRFKDEIVSNIQDIYANVKLMRIVKAKEEETNKKLSEEYFNVANFINTIEREEKPKKEKENIEQKKIKEELKFIGYIVYNDSLKQENKNIEYEFVTDILVNITKAKKDIQKVVSNILGKEMIITLIINSSKTEKSTIKLNTKTKGKTKTEIKPIKGVE